MFGYAAFCILMSKPNRIFDCLDIGAAVTNHADTVDSQKRCAAVLGIVNNLLETAKCATYKQIADFGDPTFDNLPFQHLPCGVSQPFRQLQHNIADKAITDNDINSTGKNIPALDISAII